MFSPYNYHIYQAGSDQSLWDNVGVNDEGEAPELWRGKNFYHYPHPRSTLWWNSYDIADELETMCLKMDTKRLLKAPAFAMGSHRRLGAASLIYTLDPHLIQMIMPPPFNG